jgi:hypothetical protein
MEMKGAVALSEANGLRMTDYLGMTEANGRIVLS